MMTMASGSAAMATCARPAIAVCSMPGMDGCPDHADRNCATACVAMCAAVVAQVARMPDVVLAEADVVKREPLPLVVRNQGPEPPTPRRQG